MPAKGSGSNHDAKQLKNDLKTGNIGNLYLIHGEESYLKEHYVQALITAVVDETFREFNLHILDGKTMTPETLNDAIESYPAMAKRKLVLVREFNLNKPSAAFQEILPALLENLPEYICLVFFFDVVEFKIDKRMKLHALLLKTACIAEFSPLSERELMDWVRRRVKALGKSIDDESCAYFIFHCGNSMTNLITEIEKAAAFSVTDGITKQHIDAVCTRVLDAVIFDLTDALAEQKYEQSIFILNDLLAQRNDAVQIFSAIMRHFQRMYAAKICESSRMSSQTLLEMIGSRSPYYAKRLSEGARIFSISFLRKTILLLSETDVHLKQSSMNAQNAIEVALLTMAANFGETA